MVKKCALVALLIAFGAVVALGQGTGQTQQPFGQFQSAALPAPATPALSQLPGTGSLGNGTYYVRITYTNTAGGTGETLPSVEASIPFSGCSSNCAIKITAPGASENANGYRIYISTTLGMETLQSGSGVSCPAGGATNSCAVSSSATILSLVSGVSVPTFNSTGGALNGYLTFSGTVPGQPCAPTTAPAGGVEPCASGNVLTFNPMVHQGDMIIAGVPTSQQAQLGIAPATAIGMSIANAGETLVANSSGNGAAWGNLPWSSLANPASGSSGLSLLMGGLPTTFTQSAAMTGSANMFNFTGFNGTGSNGALLSITGGGTADSQPQLSVTGKNTGVVPVTISAASGQTADILDAQVGSTNVLSVGPSALTLAGSSPTTILATLNAASGQSADIFDAQVAGTNVLSVAPRLVTINNAASLTVSGGSINIGDTNRIDGNSQGANYSVLCGQDSGNNNDINCALTVRGADHTGTGSPSVGRTAGSVAIRGGNETLEGSNTNKAGGVSVTGGNCTSPSGSCNPGSVTITSGAETGQNGAGGNLQLVLTDIKGSTYTPGNLACVTASNTISDCPSPAPSTAWVGVNLAANGDAAQYVVQGEAMVNSFASATFTAGDYVCVDGSHPAVVVDMTTACTGRQGVGIVRVTDSSTMSHSIIIARY